MREVHILDEDNSNLTCGVFEWVPNYVEHRLVSGSGMNKKYYVESRPEILFFPIEKQKAQLLQERWSNSNGRMTRLIHQRSSLGIISNRNKTFFFFFKVRSKILGETF